MNKLHTAGDRVLPSDEGLRTFPRWQSRMGTIVGCARDPDIWQVRWDGSVRVELIHGDFLLPAAAFPKAAGF